MRVEYAAVPARCTRPARTNELNIYIITNNIITTNNIIITTTVYER